MMTSLRGGALALRARSLRSALRTEGVDEARPFALFLSLPQEGGAKRTPAQRDEGDGFPYRGANNIPSRLRRDPLPLEGGENKEHAMWLNLYLIPIVIRVCLVVLFPFSALDKIVFWKDAIAQADSSFLPRWSGPPLLVAAIVVEAVAPFCIVFGWHDRIAAFVLALFCVVTAILYHSFWRYDDFWKSGNSVARSHFWDFLKNFGLVGGLLLVVFATQLAPAGVVARRPLSSTAVYTPVGTAPPSAVPGWSRSDANGH